MLKILKKLLTTQFLSALYSFIAISMIELIIRQKDLEAFILLEPIIIGMICYFISRKYSPNKWMDIFLVCLPFGFYSILTLGIYGASFPLKGRENDYGLGFFLLISVVGCWVSVIAAMVSAKIGKDKLIINENA